MTRAEGGDLRYPLPIREMERLVARKHRTLIDSIMAFGGLHREDVLAEVWSGFAARDPYDPSRGFGVVSWIEIRAGQVLLNLLDKQKVRARYPWKSPDPSASADAVDVATLRECDNDHEATIVSACDHARDAGVRLDVLLGLAVGWTHDEVEELWSGGGA